MMRKTRRDLNRLQRIVAWALMLAGAATAFNEPAAGVIGVALGVLLLRAKLV